MGHLVLLDRLYRLFEKLMLKMRLLLQNLLMLWLTHQINLHLQVLRLPMLLLQLMLRLLQLMPLLLQLMPLLLL